MNHRGICAPAIAHVANESVAEKPECQAVRQRNGEISVRADPTVRALKKLVVFRRALGGPVRAARLCRKRKRKKNSDCCFRKWD
ncbi:MAG TPA: hypothetical protein VFM25_12285 [Verrucomicrobiae bacterium]|nr:hypothetical protein [Verrucomicrobiae bacterium]